MADDLFIEMEAAQYTKTGQGACGDDVRFMTVEKENRHLVALSDGLGSGIGFTLALALVAAVREIVGAGTLTVWGDIAVKGINPGPVTLAILPAGGFIALGLLLALINWLGEWNARRHGAPAPLPINLDCRHCTMCGKGKTEEQLKG